MKRALIVFCAAALTLVVNTGWAQDDDADDADGIVPVSYNGVSWGFTRTWWTTNKYAEGYADAGTAGPAIGLRRVRPLGSGLATVLYLQYFLMHSNTSTLVGDSLYGSLVRTRAVFRELDLGVNFHAYLDSKHYWYLGGGPSVRWGHAVKRVNDEPRPGTVRKAAWFGITLLAGYQRDFGAKAVGFIEPQFTFSPDPADLWQRNYPPANLSFMMGVLWR